MAEEAVILHSGFITKRGQIVKNWKRRFFSLSKNGLLQYFDGRRCKGHVALSLSSVIRKKTECPSGVLWPSSATDDNSIGIYSNSRQIYLMFDTMEECWQWLAALQPFVTLGSSLQALNKSEYAENGHDRRLLRSQRSTEDVKACRLLESISLNIPRSTVEELTGTRAVQRTIDLMKQYTEDPEVQSQGCICLYRLAAKSRRLLGHCVKHNALEAVTTAMNLHYTDNEIQLPGIQLIQYYLERDDPHVHNQVLDERYVRRICQALKVLGRQKAVVEAALASLWLMATTCPFEWSCPAFINVGVFPTLVDVITNDCPVRDVVESAFCIVTAMMPYQSMPEVFVHCGGLHALLSVLQTYSRQPTTVIQSLILVFHLVCNSDKARESLLDQGLVECLLPFLLSSGHALPYQVSEVQSATLAVLTTIAEQDPSWLCELSGDVVSACIEVARISGDDHAVLEASLQFLQFALLSGAVESTHRKEVMSLSLTFLSSHSNNAAILSYTVAVLARLLMTNSDEIISAMSDVLEREGFVENLCNGMKRFLWNDRIQTYGCVVLYEAATLAHEKVLQRGVYDILCNALKTHPRSKAVACAALLCFESLLSAEEDKSFVQFFNSGGFTAVVTGMHKWPYSETIQTSALQILTRVALKDRRISEAIVFNGYLSLVAVSMRRHQGVVRIQTEACCCLNTLINYGTVSCLHQCEACSCVLDAMQIEGHHDNEKLQFNALSLLSMLLSFLEDWSKCLDPELCLDAVLSALCNFAYHNAFQLPGFAALLALGKTSGLLRERIVSSEVGVQQLCEAAMVVEGNPALQLRATELWKFLTGNGS